MISVMYTPTGWGRLVQVRSTTSLPRRFAISGGGRPRPHVRPAHTGGPISPQVSVSAVQQRSTATQLTEPTPVLTENRIWPGKRPHPTALPVVERLKAGFEARHQTRRKVAGHAELTGDGLRRDAIRFGDGESH
jgi:hypothetical protein